MKNQIFSFSFILIMTIVLASCGNKSNTAQTPAAPTEATTAVDTSSAAKPMAAVYQCPMKCEGEKTYDAAGKCPKCGMDLKQLENHEEHEH